MARKKDETPKERQRANVDNPFIHVPFARQDLASVDRNGGGGGKILVTVDSAYRKALSESLHESFAALATERMRYPQGLSSFIFRLRETGIAKSHRPIKLTEEAGLQAIGHGQIDEMLVATSAGGVQALNNVILRRDTVAIQANLSAIERIEPWSRERRNPYGEGRLRDAGRAVLRLFRYPNSEISRNNFSLFTDLLKHLGLTFTELWQPRGMPLLAIRDLDKLDDDKLDQILDYPGAKSIIPEPIYRSGSTVLVAPQSASVSTTSAASQAILPTVAVADSGVSKAAAAIKSFVVSQDIFVLPPDTDHGHGTMVASLVAGANHFNNGHAWIPRTQAFVHDVCLLETNGSLMSDIELRLREAVNRRPDIKVWNLSLGGEPCSDQTFSDLSIALDELSDRYGVLFVVSAGNYLDQPRRSWPNPALILADRVSAPAESVRALTVASVSHIDSPGALSAAGEPTPYTRCGPGPVFTPKPDINHVGGGVHAPWDSGASSLAVITPSNSLALGFGTSFAAPIASSMAANAWQAISGRKELQPSPSLIKALMIHSAQLVSPHYDHFERRYYGAGRPDDVLGVLYDSSDSFTMVFQADLVPGMRWRKPNYPIPKALIHDGKFRGEIIITAAYAPPLDPNAGSEYVRANVELSFGVLKDGRITGKVPMDGEEGQSGYESAQVEHGGKWSPVKVHRKTFPEGTAGDVWCLQATAILRAFEPAMSSPLPVSIIVTLRALDGDVNVRADGMRALSLVNWVHSPLPVRVPVKI